VEILSESTELYDRVVKFNHYRTVPSIAEYLLVSSLRVSAELFTRQSDDRWLLTTKSSLEDSVTLESIDCHLSLADLYEKVEFGPRDPSMAPPVNPSPR
jgi:Uma2 family endonuclease